MSPGIALSAAAALAGFLLKTTLAFAVCLIISRLAGSPGRRFAVWAIYLFGMAVCWLGLLAGLLGAAPPAKPAALPIQNLAATGLSSPPSLTSTSSTSSIRRASPRYFHPISGLGLPLGLNLPPASLRVPERYAFLLRIFLFGAGAAYALMLIYILFDYSRKQRKLKWIMGFAWQPPAHAQQMFRQLAARVGAPRTDLLVLSGVDSPATFGWIKPLVVAPEECMREDFEGLESILLHELHHVRRRDYAWNQMALACRALLLFHPAAWYAASRMQMERELACDLAVVAGSPADKAEYAECLLRFARLQSAQQPQPWGIDFAGPAGRLKTRIQLILEEPERISYGIWGLRAGAAGVLLAAFLYAAPALQVMLQYGRRPASPTVGISPQDETAAPASIEGSRTGKGAPSAERWPRRLVTPWPAGRNLAQGDAIATGRSDPAAAPPIPAPTRSVGQSTLGDSPGPHLLRRLDGTGKAFAPGGVNERESIALIDSDSSAEAKSEQAKSRKRGLKDAATAVLAIGKVMSDVDHR